MGSPGPGSCPVCERAASAPACECGYDFETHDPRIAILRLETQVRIGNKWWLRGLVLLLALPIGFWLDSTLGAVLVLVQLIAAAVFITHGISRADKANEKLAAARQRMALPAARLVQQSQPKARS